MQAGSNEIGAGVVLRYAAACQPVQEELQQILTQVAGFALLIMMKRGQASLCAGPLEIAQSRMRDVSERTRAISRHSGSAHHRHHLDTAAKELTRALETALACLKSASGEREREMLTLHLRAATNHLRATARILPGFEWIDLRQACCAAHAPGQSIFTAAAV